MRNIIFIIFVFTLSLSSCSKKEEKNNDIFSLLQRKWVLSDSGEILHLTQFDKKYIAFNNGGGMSVKKEQLLKFTGTGSQFPKSETKGTWKFIQTPNHVNDTLRLSFFKDINLEVDSIVVSTKNGKQEIEFIDSNNHKHKISKGELKTGFTQVNINYIVKKITTNDLVLLHNGKEIKYSYTSPSLETVFSWMSIWRGLLGIIVLIGIAFLLSSNRKKVSWRTVAIGLAMQVLLAVGILKVDIIQSFFEKIGSFFVIILDFTKEGSTFLFGGFMDIDTVGFIFAFQVLPTIIFFAALTSLLFYLGIIQKVVYGLAWIMTKLLGISGPESLSVAGNIFLGQTESPLMIKAYLERMSRSEILLVMIGGMATLAGGVLAAYIAFLGGDDPIQRLFFAKHLLAASFMAAPGAIVVAKILVPQTEEIDTNVNVPKEKIGSNVLDAIANGTTEGLKLAANVAAMLLVFVAFIAMANYIFNWIGDITSINAHLSDWTNGQYSKLSLEMILGYIFAPLMWLIGVAKEDITLVGRLLGEKVIMTEFIGYVSLASLKSAGAFASPKSIIIATYMLCGFANFASIGIQIGGIGTLAPTKRKLLSEFGVKALIGGTLASLLSATMVGMIIG